MKVKKEHSLKFNNLKEREIGIKTLENDFCLIYFFSLVKRLRIIQQSPQVSLAAGSAYPKLLLLLLLLL